MQTFFQSIVDIEQYIEPYRRAYELRCAHCDLLGHLVGHGFVYQQVSMDKRQVVGKRLVCSNRFGHAGCGRTIQLRLAEQLPNRQYSALHLSVFIALLLAQVSVVKAYQQATGQTSSRQAWRWLKALKYNLMQYRLLLRSPLSSDCQHARRRHPLFATLFAVCSVFTGPVGLAFQLQAQTAFI